MKDKARMKIGMKRAKTRLMVILYSILFAAAIWGCLQAPASIPEKLSGIYRTTHPEYNNQFFGLGSRSVTMGFGMGKYKYYNVEKVEIETADNRILYTILCANESEGEEFNFAFFADIADEVIIHFKNKPYVAWEKQESGISYGDQFI